MESSNHLFHSPFGSQVIGLDKVLTQVDHTTPGRYCELYGMDEYPDLKLGMDFRRPEFRREVFLRFYEFCLKYRLHAGASLPYMTIPFLRKELKWTLEELLWFVFINGNTQHPLTSYLIFKRFPDFAHLDIPALDAWYNKEWPRLEFDTDRRHQKRDFIKSVTEYKKLVGFDQLHFFCDMIDLAASDDPRDKFKTMWKIVREDFYSFGRMSTYSYLEYLRIAGLEVEPHSLFLEDISGSKSLRNGLAKVLGRDDLDWGGPDNPTGFEGKYTPQMMEWLQQEGAVILKEAKVRFAGRDFERDVNYFTLES